jgi:flagellar basal body-associated protein FliL
MAFCNSCGASLTPGTRFCNKCGATVLASSPAPNVASPAPTGTAVPATSLPPSPTGQGSGALKVILIVVGVIVLLGILSVGSVVFFFWHVARHARVHQDGNNVRVETPFGNVETTKDPADAARNLGVDIYPEAEILKNGSATASFGGIHTASVNSESTDSVDKVASFYKAKFPNAMVTSADSNRCTIISNDRKNMITINIEAQGDKTKIMITNVSRNSGAANSSSD